MYIKDASLLIAAMNRFYAYIQSADYKTTGVCRDRISFTDQNSLIGREEDYKYAAAINGRKVLDVEYWKKDWIGTGKIAAKASKAIGTAGNLVNRNQQIDFKNRLNPDHPKYKPDAERVLYDIYCGVDAKSAFEQAVNTFGAKYDTIAYLFFMKSYDQYLPISPGNFDRVFLSVGIEFETSFRCEWSNYCKYIAIIREVQNLINEYLPLDSEARLIDAHSFLWFINEDRFSKWHPDVAMASKIETRTEECLIKASGGQPKKKQQNSLVYERNAQVVKYTREKAGGICQLCNCHAPFSDKHGIPYLEVHHVIWLSRGGQDDVRNTVALCPNCHAKMHIVDDILDVEYLQNIAHANK